VVDREIEIRRHVPEPYWTISAEFEKNKYIITVHDYRQKIGRLSQVSSVVNICTKQDGRITRIEKQKVTLRAHTPFNLGDLQKEAYRVFRFSPSYTLSIAERLYIASLISIRQCSQKLPTSINYRKIISNLSKIGYPYSHLTTTLLARDHLFPN
jgi:DNA topoisomerase-1